MNRHLVALWAVVALAIAAPAVAQAGREPPHRQSVGGGAQWAYPASSGGEITGTPGFAGSWRAWFGPHLGLEGEFGFWRRSRTHEFSSPGYQDPLGFVNEPVHGTAQNRLSTYSLGANVLGRIPIRRAAIVLGGGPGLYAERFSYDVLVNERRDSGSSGSMHFGVQSLAELEFRITPHVNAFGGLRIELRDVRYVDSGVVYPTVGLRYAF